MPVVAVVPKDVVVLPPLVVVIVENVDAVALWLVCCVVPSSVDWVVPSSVGFVEGLLSDLTSGFPSVSMSISGKPSGGGIMPPPGGPVNGKMMIPPWPPPLDPPGHPPRPHHQIGKTVGSEDPSSFVVVTECVVKPGISVVMVENGPLSVVVCGGRVMPPGILDVGVCEGTIWKLIN